MADGYDRFENEGTGGGSFVMGLLTGTVLGAGLGMLFAPKSGSELRNQLSEQAGNFANSASQQYRRATEAASDWAERGREASRDIYDKARDAVSRGTDEAQRYARETTAAGPRAGTGPQTTNTAGSSFGTGSTFGGGSETVRGASTEQTRGGTPNTPQSGGPRRG
jgi:gas vesicle protein